MNFQLWSDSNPEVRSELTPDLGFRTWDDLTSDDKYKMWQHLRTEFFEKKPLYNKSNPWADKNGKYYKFQDEPKLELKRRRRILNTIANLNYYYKAQSYGADFLEEATLSNACSDFFRIFSTGTGNVVLELLSIYANEIIIEEKEPYLELPAIENEAFKERKRHWDWAHFRIFAGLLNDVFSQFGVNVLLTEAGFIPRQEDKIVAEIYLPVLQALSREEYKNVNSLLSECFSEFRKNTPEAFSTCITKAVSAVQAFLQIKVYGKVGKGDISKLIPEAQKKNHIPGDLFTTEIFKKIEAFMAKERQETGDAHPRQEFANQKNAILVLNMTMVFIQHCI